MSVLFTIAACFFFLKCIGLLFIAFGLIVLVFSFIGLIRFSGFYAKLQAVGLMDLCGFVSIFLGLGLCFLWLLPKMLLIVLLILVLSPIVSNIMCRIVDLSKR